MERITGFLNMLQISNAPTTFRRKKAQLKAYLNKLAENKKHYHDATKEIIEQYLLSLPGGQQSKQQCCQVIKEFYDYLHLKENPAIKIKVKNAISKNRLRLFRIPSVSDMEKLLSVKGNSILTKRNFLMLELAYGSGLRRTELLRLDIEDVDLVEKTVHVHGKGNKDRVVPITESAVKALREYLFYSPVIRGPLLRSCRGKRLTPEWLTAIFKNKIGIRPHLFRHACAVHMLKAGCSIRYIQQLLGHERLDSTQIYTRIDKKNLSEIIHRTHPRSI